MISILQNEPTLVVDLASFSPDGTRIVTAGSRGEINLWDREGNLVNPLKGHQYWVQSASFSRDGTQLVTGSDDGTSRLWDVKSGSSKVLDEGNGGIHTVNFSPDGSQLVTVGADDTARLWDRFGNLLTTLDGQLGLEADFSADGTRLVTTDFDQVYLWNKGGKLLTTLEGGTFSINSQGTLLGAVGRDGVVRLYKIWSGIDEMLDEAVDRAGRTLTNRECQQYLHSDSCHQ